MTTSVAPSRIAPPGSARSSTSTRSKTSTCDNCFRRIRDRGQRLTHEAGGVYLDYSKNRVTDETIRLLVQLAEESGLRRADRGHVPRREDQRHRKPRRAARGAAAPRGRRDRRRRRERRARGARRARQDGRLLRARAQRASGWAITGKRDQERDQHRHRRLRPGAGHGLRGAAALQPTAT